MTVWTDPVLVRVRSKKLYAVENSNILTVESEVLDDLINRQGKHEIDMVDFEPETVVLFISALEEKVLDPIDDAHFHDLLRLSVEFEVQWLIKECHKHFATKIREQEQRCLLEGWEYKEMESIWEECKFMVNQWGDPYLVFVDLFVKTAKELNSSGHVKFVEGFVKRDMTPLEINVILRSAEISTIGYIMKTLLEDIESNNQLTEMAKLLLENLNMPLCKVHCRDDFAKMVQIVSDRFLTMNTGDLKLIFDVVKSTSEWPPAKCLSRENDVFDYKWMESKFFQDPNVTSITEVALDAELKSANTLIDFILHLLLGFENSITQLDNVEDIFRDLEKICGDKNLKRAHRPYIRSIINLLQHLTMDIWDGVLDNYIRLLNLIEYSEVMSSEYDSVVVECSGSVEDLKYFWFSHPGENGNSYGWKGSRSGFVIDTGGPGTKFIRIDSCKSEPKKEKILEVKFETKEDVTNVNEGKSGEPVTLNGDQSIASESTLNFEESNEGDTLNDEGTKEETPNGEVIVNEDKPKERAPPEFLRMMSETVENWKAALGRRPRPQKGHSKSLGDLVNMAKVEPELEPEPEPEPAPKIPEELPDIHCQDLVSADDMSLLYTKLEVAKVENPGDSFTAILPVPLIKAVTSLLGEDEEYIVTQLTLGESGEGLEFVIYNIADCLVKRRVYNSRVDVEDKLEVEKHADELKVEADAAVSLVEDVIANAEQSLQESEAAM